MMEIRKRVFFWMDKLEVFGKALNKPKVLSALNGLVRLYERLTSIQEPKALLTCKDCLVDLD